MPETCPEGDREAIRLAAYAGVPLTGILHAYRIGHDVSLEGWLESVEALDMDTGEREACTHAIVRFTLDYNDRLMSLLGAEYQSECSRVLGRSDQARLRVMRDLVEGVSDRAPTLEYDLDLEHIGLIAWGDGADTTLQSLAHVLDARLVSAPTPAGFRWAWLGSRSFDSDAVARLRRHGTKDGSAVAVGHPADGISGFRRTHRQANAAHMVATRRPQPLTLYQDVALEALALRDESAAREFVADVLRGINGDESRSTGLRETLSAYFESEQNATSTAAALQIHEATVGRRLAEIEKRMGQRVNQRRAELETALRLRLIVSR
jgi:hypothetical protein